MGIHLDARGRRSLTLAVVASILFGVFMLAPYFGVIALSVISAYIFYPIFKWFFRYIGNAGLAAGLTALLTLLVVIIPITVVSFATFNEVQRATTSLSNYAANNDLGQMGNAAVAKLNEILFNLSSGLFSLDVAQLKEFITSSASKIANFGISLLTSSVGGVGAFFIALILYLYIFSSVLVHHQSVIRTFKSLNPLGDEVSDLYFKQAGAMTKAMVRGQLIIAFLQGLLGATVLYFVGIELFWLLLLVLTLLSFIPLGAGVVIIPIGIIYMVTGNFVTGLIILLAHFFIITNVDNILRPLLVPKDARLNPALTLLSVFAGIGLFGLLGIVIGPVIMILIVTTIKLYVEKLDAEKFEAASKSHKLKKKPV